MPELPEVETIVKELDKKIRDKKIKDIEVRVTKIAKGNLGKAKDLKIKKVERRAKLIIIHLTGDYSLVTHLKMTGQLFFLPPSRDETKTGERIGKYTHVILYFTDGSKLLFNDVRKFGWIKILTDNELEKEISTQKYGPEPLAKEFTLGKLKEILRDKPNLKIKSTLIDQSIIAGIGNLYSDEILFEAKIHPLKKNNTISEDEVKDLYKAINKVLKQAIKYQGASIDRYRRTTGEKGSYEQHRKVYRREGLRCQRCNREISRIKVGSRSSYFCPKCQRL